MSSKSNIYVYPVVRRRERLIQKGIDFVLAKVTASLKGFIKYLLIKLHF